MVHIPAVHIAQAHIAAAVPRGTRIRAGSTAAAILAALVVLFVFVSAQIATVVLFGAVIATLCIVVMVYAARHREPLDLD